MLLRLILPCCVLCAIEAQVRSPCPRLFRYDGKVSNDSWQGTLTMFTSQELFGVWIQLNLNSSVNVLSTRFGLPSTDNNKDFLIEAPDRHLQENSIHFVRFTARYSPQRHVPAVRRISVNGKTICPRRGMRARKQPAVFLNAR